MSTLLFPISLPGTDIKFRRNGPLFKNFIQRTLAGLEIRYTYETIPTYEFTFDFNLLRATPLFLEFQKLVGFFGRHNGTFDSFLLQDPDDNSVASHYFGKGDGTTTAFQLQRTLVADADLNAPVSRSYWPVVGDAYEPIFELNGNPTLFQSGDYQGLRQLSTANRTNNALQSAAFDNASWGKANATVVANAIAAPDGTTTAESLTEDSTATVEHKVSQSQAMTASQPYVVSVFVKKNTAQYFCIRTNSLAQQAFFDLNAGTVFGTPTNCTASIQAVGSGWYRVAIFFIANSADVHFCLSATGTSTTYTGTSTLSVYLWGAQVEQSAALTSYIPTTTVAVTAGADYTLPGSGTVQLAVAPAVNAVLSWTGSFYRRVRFDTDGIAADRIVQSWYEAKQVKLVSVKPSEQNMALQQIPIPHSETPSGSITGTTGSDGNPTFTLANTPISGYPVNVFRNGQRLAQGTDYSVSSNVITFVAPNIPVGSPTVDTILVDYYSYT